MSMKKATYIVYLPSFLIACSGCHCKLSQNSCVPIAAEKGEMTENNITPLAKELKKAVVEDMALPELEQLLGPHHVAHGSGVSYLVWYFDDHTCLAIFYTGVQHDATKQFFWLPCEVGRFKMSMIKEVQNREGAGINPESANSDQESAVKPYCEGAR